MKEKHRPLSAAEFWAVSDLFRDQETQWEPVNAGYELRRFIKMENSKWSVCFKVHAVPDSSPRAGSSKRVRFKSSVTIWPPKLSAEQEKRLARAGWYRALEKAVDAGGYRGKWMPSLSGKFGDFWKDLSSVDDVRREATWLGEFTFESVASDLQANGDAQPIVATRKRR
jgi:hypothetical protein